MNLLKTKIFLVIFFGTIFTASAGYLEDLKIDYPGQYCQRQWSQQRCCPNRHDNCSLPISTTLCYCDEFCKRDHGPDCCPDYISWCEGRPEPTITCLYEGGHYRPGTHFMNNCNLCTCTLGGVMHCETDICLQDANIIHNINAIHSLNWQARNYTEFWGRKFKEGLTLRLGTFEPTYRVKAMLSITNRADVLPRHFDSIKEWPRLISGVRDQGWCGSSWVISTTSVASDRFGIQSRGEEIVELSPQNILSCTRRQRGCDGGHLDAAWRFLHKQGVVDEDCYPYEGKVTECRVHRPYSLRNMGCRIPTINRISSQPVERDHFYAVAPPYSINNETDIMMEIKKSGPVQATMRVYRDFFSYSGGIYRRSAASRDEQYGFHSVKLIGWGEERIGYDVEKYWIAANSWGTWWGENGYFRILRGVNECLIEDYVLASWPHVANPVYKNAHTLNYHK